MTKAMVCIVRSALAPAPLVLRLSQVGVSPKAISVLVPDWPAPSPLVETAVPVQQEVHTTAIDPAKAALPGSLPGRLAGTGLLAIPGLGLFVAAGPIIAALSAATLDLARGRVAAALVTMGLPEFEAAVCEARVVAGHSLLSVQTRGELQTRQVRQLLAAA